MALCASQGGAAANDAVARSTSSATGLATAGATALKEEPEEFGEAEMSKLGFAAPAAQPTASERRAEAIMKGYVGDSCGECGNFTLVRNGTCLKCNTCGSTNRQGNGYRYKRCTTNRQRWKSDRLRCSISFFRNS